MKHSFQPYPIELLDFDPFKKIGKENMLITVGNEEKQNAMTAGWGSIGFLWGMNTVSVYIRESRYTKELMDQFSHFSLSFLNPDDKATKRLLSYFGTVSGRNEDKFKNASMEVDFDHGIPYLDDANLVFLCRKLSCTLINTEDFVDDKLEQKWYANGDPHYMYVGEILKVMAR